MKKSVLLWIIVSSLFCSNVIAAGIVSFRQLNNLNNASVLAYPQAMSNHATLYSIPMRNGYFHVSNFTSRDSRLVKLANSPYQNFKLLKVDQTIRSGVLGVLSMANEQGETITYQVIMQ